VAANGIPAATTHGGGEDRYKVEPEPGAGCSRNPAETSSYSPSVGSSY